MPLTTLLCTALLALPAQGQSTPPGMLALLDSGPDPALLEQIRRRPNDVRETFAGLFERSARAVRARERVRLLGQAERLGALYARVWSDSFFVRRVRQFERWSPDERAEHLEADSLRRAGNAAYRTGGPDSAIALWERSLTKHRALGDLAGQAAVLGNLGAGYFALGRLERALRYYTQALHLAEAAGDLRTRGNALGNIASVHRARGELTLAAEFYGRALEVRPRTGDRRGQVSDLNNLALVRADLGDLRGAERQLRRALAINRHDGRDDAAADNLTNLANLATQRGEYDTARVGYVAAVTLHHRAGNARGAALALEDLGLLHLRWGDYPAALESLEQARAILVRTGPRIRRADVESDFAAVRAAMGELPAALRDLDSAEALAADDESLGPALLLQRADLLSDLNQDPRAARLYEQAEAGYGRLDDAAGQAEARQGLGYLHLARGDFTAAEEAFTRALELQEALDDPRPAALTRVLLGRVRRLEGDTAGARQAYRQALAEHIALGDRAAEAMTLGALADLDRETGALDAAAAEYRTALRRIDSLPVLPVRWQLEFGLGLTLRERGDLDAAAAELGAAVSQLERAGATFTVEERRYRYLEDKWSAYAELAKTELARGRIAHAFQISESMRARQLLDLLARGRTTSGTGSPALIREEETQRRRIGALTTAWRTSVERAGSLRGAAADPDKGTDIREALLVAQAQYERLLVKLKASRPDYASLVMGTPVGAGAVERALPPDAVLIEYLVSDDWTLAFVVSNERIAAVELPVGRHRLQELIRFFRGTLEPSADHAGDELWRTPLRGLYRQLVAPLDAAGYLEGKHLLLIAPHAELHYLPFAALLRPGSSGETFLIQSYDVAYVPSASVWTQLARRRRSGAGHGLLAMAPLPDALRHSVGEVRAISRGRPGAAVIVGPQATEARFRALAPDRRFLHLATAGVLNNRNPLFSYVRLNPAGESDGRLEVHEVFDLHLAADLVVLSACETGLGTGARQEVPPGDDWVGFVRAFLFAGAQSVVASLWPVEDEATARLMEQFYRGLWSGSSKAHAMGEAQRAFIRDREHASPFYWAAFELTGGVH